MLPGGQLGRGWADQGTRADGSREAGPATSQDVLALPALPLGVPDWDQVHTGQPRFEARQLLSLHHHMGFVNYLGLPALNLPLGLDEHQRPVCVQLLARPYAEHLLLDFARQQMPQPV